MSWNLRTRLGFFVSTLLALAMGFSSLLVLRLYSQDKKSDIELFQKMTTRQMASEFEHLLVLSESVPLDRALTIDSFIFAVEDPCAFGTALTGGVQKRYQSRLNELKLTPASWANSLEVQEACHQLTTEPAPHSPILLTTPIAFSLPYLLVLNQTGGKNRLIMIAMDSFYSGHSGTAFLIDSNAKLIWTADGTHFLDQAFRAVSTDLPRINDFIRAKQSNPKKSEPYSVQDFGQDGILTLAQVSKWTFCSLFYRPKLFSTLTFALNQAILLILGIFFFGIFFGKAVAQNIAKPLEALKHYAETLSKGDFLSRIEETGIEEVMSVKKAFNTMAKRIAELLDTVKEKAEVDAELAIAQQVQVMLLPEKQVVTERQKLYSYMKPATYCGGDWWGWTEIPRQNEQPLTIVMIGDVTGHGLGPALVTAAVRGALNAISDSERNNSSYVADPKLILQELNRTIFQVARGAFLMSFLAAVYDPTKGTLTILNAGHTWPYVIRELESGEFELKQVGKAGSVLGASLDPVAIGIDTVNWNPKTHKLLLYTDGLTDNSDETTNRFGRNHLKISLNKHIRESSAQLLESVLRDRAAAAGDIIQADDITVIVCEVGLA